MKASHKFHVFIVCTSPTSHTDWYYTLPEIDRIRRRRRTPVLLIKTCCWRSSVVHSFRLLPKHFRMSWQLLWAHSFIIVKLICKLTTHNQRHWEVKMFLTLYSEFSLLLFTAHPIKIEMSCVYIKNLHLVQFYVEKL